MLNHERLANANHSPMLLTEIGKEPVKDVFTSLLFYCSFKN